MEIINWIEKQLWSGLGDPSVKFEPKLKLHIELRAMELCNKLEWEIQDMNDMTVIENGFRTFTDEVEIDEEGRIVIKLQEAFPYANLKPGDWFRLKRGQSILYMKLKENVFGHDVMNSTGSFLKSTDIVSSVDQLIFRAEDEEEINLVNNAYETLRIKNE